MPGRHQGQNLEVKIQYHPSSNFSVLPATMYAFFHNWWWQHTDYYVWNTRFMDYLSILCIAFKCCVNDCCYSVNIKTMLKTLIGQGFCCCWVFCFVLFFYKQGRAMWTVILTLNLCNVWVTDSKQHCMGSINLKPFSDTVPTRAEY